MTEREFNPHGNKTADGVLIVRGLRVVDNNYDVGTVEADDHDGDYGREDQHWFRVVLDYIPNAPSYSGNRHGGYRTMNGERLSTTLDGKNGGRITVEDRAIELGATPPPRLVMRDGQLVVDED